MIKLHLPVWELAAHGVVLGLIGWFRVRAELLKRTLRGEALSARLARRGSKGMSHKPRLLLTTYDVE